MIGKKYSEIIRNLVTNGRWSIDGLGCEEGFTTLFAWINGRIEVLEITHKDGVITRVYKYHH